MNKLDEKQYIPSFTDRQEVELIENNTDEQAMRIVETLGKNPELVQGLLAESVTKATNDTIIALNKALEIVTADEGNDEGFDKMFGNKQDYSSGTLGNKIAETYFKNIL